VNELKIALGRDPTELEIEGMQVPDENRPHIFWECPIVNQCVHEVYHNLWGGNGQVDKKSFLMGKEMHHGSNYAAHVSKHVYKV
jgi:hypothetical protein